MTGKTILVTSAAHELGRLAAHALSHSGHTVYGALPGQHPSDPRFADMLDYAREFVVDLRPVTLDPHSEMQAVEHILAETGRLDVVVHIHEHLGFGPAEAFTPEQFAQVYDRTVLAAQRVNRAALPAMRRRREGLLVWVSSTSPAGGSLPFLAPYTAAKAALDALAVAYASELVPWGIETSIIAPGVQLQGGPRLDEADRPDDMLRAAEYETGPLTDGMDRVRAAIAHLAPDADLGPIAGAVAEVVDTPSGERPFRLVIDPAQDGGAIGFAVIDRLRNELLNRVSLGELAQACGR